MIGLLVLFMMMRSKKQPAKVQLIIARYNEDLDWLDEFDITDDIEIIIYEKGDVTMPCKQRKNCRNYRLPNVGREYHTYLYHIIKNYKNLPDIILFGPGSLRRADKFANFTYFFNNRDKVDQIYKVEQHNVPLNDAVRDFRILHYQTTNEQNRQKNSETQIQPARFHPFGEWYRRHFDPKKPIRKIVLGGVGISTRERIRKNPISFYKRIYKELSTSSNPEEGHYVERTWFAMFDNQ